jgi:hypothetical protein
MAIKKPSILPSLPPRGKKNMITKEDIDVYQELSRFEEHLMKKEQEVIKLEPTTQEQVVYSKRMSSAAPSLPSAIYGSLENASESYPEEELAPEKNFHFYQVIFFKFLSKVTTKVC